MPFEWVVKKSCATVRGWIGYFHYRNRSQLLGGIRHHLEQRMITHLRKPAQGPGQVCRVHQVSNRSLYEKYGLYKVPTTAGWKNVHAL